MKKFKEFRKEVEEGVGVRSAGSQAAHDDIQRMMNRNREKEQAKKKEAPHNTSATQGKMMSPKGRMYGEETLEESFMSTPITAGLEGVIDTINKMNGPEASVTKIDVLEVEDEVEEITEEAVPVEKPKKEKATANHPAEDGIEGDLESPKQGSSEEPKLTHMCAMKVMHPKFGEGKPIMGEHAEPDANGNIWWYKVMYEHGIETCETYAMEVLEESSHGNHKKKK
jgi:hypothetical protein